MKKLFLILAILIAYTASTSTIKAVQVEKSKVTIVANTNDSVTIADEDKKVEKKKTEKKATAACGAAKEEKAGCSESMQKSCAASKKTCAGEATKTETKSCCGEKK